MWKALALALLVAASLGIAAGWTRMSQTWDEPGHIATGIEWLEGGPYSMWTETPPLARIGAGLFVWLDGARLPAQGHDRQAIERDMWVAYELGNRILWETGDYPRRLALARAGTLLFLWLAAFALWRVSRAAGEAAAFLAISSFVTLPGILAHSGLATTDIGFCALALVFVWRLVRWLDLGDARSAVLMGFAAGAVTGTKFWSFIFIPAAIAGFGLAWASQARTTPTLFAERISGRLRSAPAVAFAALVTVWALYRFSWGTIAGFPGFMGDLTIVDPSRGDMQGVISRVTEGVSMPAPAFLHGVLMLLAHNAAGHPAYALGTESQTGFWYFFPLTLLLKTPFPFLLLGALGATLWIWTRRNAAWWTSGAWLTVPLVLLAMMTSRVNIGLRHVLVVYGLVALGTAGAAASALGAVQERERRALLAAIAGLSLWQATITTRAFPDWMTYFNPIAAHDPGAYLVDSDLDWGQGLFELESYFKTHPLAASEPVWLAYFGSADVSRFSLPPLRSLPPQTRVRGWIAISERRYRDARSYGWLHEYTPVAVVGRVIRVYKIP